MAETAKKKMGVDFTEGKILPMMIRFIGPFLLANLLNSLYNTIDTMIIGQFVGSTGIVAVSLGGKMLNLFTNVGVALAGGGQIFIAQIIGAKRRDQLNSAIGTLLSEMFGLAVIFAVITLILSRNIIVWLNTPAESFDAALNYLRITCIGLPLIFGYNATSSVLRGMGDSMKPLIFIAIAAGFNLIGDIIFIVVFGLGATGTAIATVLGQGLSLVCSTVFLYKKKEQFGFDFKLKSFAIDWKKFWIVFKLGFPNVIRSFFITGTQLVLMGYINMFGVESSAAYSIGDKVYHMANIFSTSVQAASGSLIGQNFAAGKHDRIRKIMRYSFLMVVSVAAVLSAASLLFPKAIFGLFTSEPGVLTFARPMMAISCIIYFLSSIMAAYEGVVAGTGNSILRMIGGILDGVVFRIGLSFLFAYVFHMDVLGFFLADACSRLAPVSIGMIYYHSGAWKKRKVLIKS
ncbi:MAG: MATE family efflux transporter [Lachnospiraceae bacterium]|nr:MATE family efflux transporter [Lachnospiraceae bacterium]